MDIELVFYGAAVAWFTHTCFRIATLIYQFEMYPKTYGHLPNITISDLLSEARKKERDLPAFRIVVPAYLEAAVIEGTINRLASINYPQTHLEIFVATYEDEPVHKGIPSTYMAAIEAAKKINHKAGRTLVKPLLVPATFDGYFPGTIDAEYQHIGKSRGLNYTLRTLHELNEEDERSYFVGKLIQTGIYSEVDAFLSDMEKKVKNNPNVVLSGLLHFLDDPKSTGYLGGVATSRQLNRLLDLVNALPVDSDELKSSRDSLYQLIAIEGGRFYLKPVYSDSSKTILSNFKVMDGKEFLHAVMMRVESLEDNELVTYALKRENSLQYERPSIYRQIKQNIFGIEDLYQIVRHFNSRWMMVYDADADAPVDVLRYLSAKILTKPDVMGFQGPVAPVANYHEVHPLCKLGGLWMGFWHNTSYPRLMQRLEWAHPLAGTNWCFRIDGFEESGRLVRDCRYDESKRHFILSFDPQQLTEDLEAGIRIFSDWRVNADWHPYIETEQVPPNPSQMVIQRTRWTEGTLQTLRYIMVSRLPIFQKIRFALHPMEIMVSGSGPLITIALWILMYQGNLTTNPIFMFWTVLLTFGNLLYIVSFQRAYVRFEGMLHRNELIDYLLRYGESLITDIKKYVDDKSLNEQDSTLIQDVTRRLQESLRSNGTLTRQLQTRCVDERLLNTNNDIGKDNELCVLRDSTPMLITREYLERIAFNMSELSVKSLAIDMENVSTNCTDKGVDNLKISRGMDKGVYMSLEKLHDMLSPWYISKRKDDNWLKDRYQIWMWTFPYLFFQLAPYFKGLWYWVSGRPRSNWHKTPRTPKEVVK